MTKTSFLYRCASIALLFSAVTYWTYVQPVESNAASPYDPVPPNQVFKTQTLTTSATTVALSTDVALTSSYVEIQGNSGVGFIPSFVLNGASTGNVTFRFAVSTDGANWTTTTPVTYTVAATGTTPVVAFVPFGPKDGLSNIKYIRLASINNAATNGLTNLVLKAVTLPAGN